MLMVSPSLVVAQDSICGHWQFDGMKIQKVKEGVQETKILLTLTIFLSLWVAIFIVKLDSLLQQLPTSGWSWICCKTVHFCDKY